MRPGKFAPFIHTKITTPYIGLEYLVALMPCIVYAIISYGVRALVIIAFSAVLSMFLDYLVVRIKKQTKDNNHYFDFSSVSLGIVFALLLPPDSSLIIASLGILFAVLVVKHLFGGTGSHIFNASVAGRLFVEAVYPSQLDTFAAPGTKLLEFKSLLFNSNTSESIIQVGSDINDYSFVELLAGRYPSFIGTGCSLLIIIGFLYLFKSKTIRLATAFSFIPAAFVALLIAYKAQGVLFVCSDMLVSGALFVAFFLLTDLTNIANSFRASVVIGIISGVVFGVSRFMFSPIIAICVSCLASNLLSFVADYMKYGCVYTESEGNNG